MTGIARGATMEPPQVGDAIAPIEMFLSLQRLIMVSGANRDFAATHIDNEAARASGAESAFADIMFVFTMVERLLLEWAGPSAVLLGLGPLKLRDFVLSGYDLTIEGVIASVASAERRGRPGWDVVIDVRFVQGERVPVVGAGRVWVGSPQ